MFNLFFKFVIIIAYVLSGCVYVCAHRADRHWCWVTCSGHRAMEIVDLDVQPHYNAKSYRELPFALRENSIINLHFTEGEKGGI